MQIAPVSVAVGLVALLGLRHPVPSELNARQILERTARAYAECQTYRDSGVVKTIFITDKGKRTVAKPFTTAFVNPDRFRYEFKDRRGEEDFDRYLIWQNGQEVRTWWDIRPGVEHPSSLERALAAARGVSAASSCTIPDLLAGFSTGFPHVTRMPNAERKADEELDGSLCFVVEGGTLEKPMTLWIDQQTFLLRRIDERKTFPDFYTEATTTYAPVVDGEVPESLLVFDPPAPGPVATETSRGFHRPAPDDLNAPQILERTGRVYAECRTYRDSGVARRHWTPEDGRNRTERVPFTTAFVRPGGFRFECTTRRGEEEFDRIVVWRENEAIYSWQDERQCIERQGLAPALASANVGTFFSARWVPCLLSLEEMPPPRMTDLPEPERMEDEEIDGSPCFVIQGRWMGQSFTLWIDQWTFLLRRIVSVDGEGEYETTTTYEPVVDEEIPESLLRFEPPAPEGR